MKKVALKFIIKMMPMVLAEALAMVLILNKDISVITALILCVAFSLGLLMGGIIVWARMIQQSSPEELFNVRGNADYIEDISNIMGIFEHAGKSVAFFEKKDKEDKVFVTSKFFDLVDENSADVGYAGFIPQNVFESKLVKLSRYEVKGTTSEGQKLYYVEDANRKSKWLSITTFPSEGKLSGFIENVSEEMLAKTKLEFERDYDVLTSLLNRRAFHAKIQKILSGPDKDLMGAMISIDLDNLKFINDNFGHDYGDEYLRAMAAVLNSVCGSNAVISRFGGDEFTVFVHGYEDILDIKYLLVDLEKALAKKKISLPDGKEVSLSASIGVAWYPNDSSSYKLLIKYSDFAMYSVKKDSKGAVGEFCLRDYEHHSNCFGVSDVLEEFIVRKDFKYTFQPIVDAKTGNIFGYEALLKSTHPAIKTPKQLLELSKSQRDFYQIEKLTWTESLSAFDELNPGPNVKLFINSIADQCLDTEDMNEIKREYCHLLSQVVVEVENAGEPNIEYTKAKANFLSQWGGQLAVADFGIGTYSETSIRTMGPGYLKVDLSITQNLYRDENRLKFVESLVAYAHQRNIKVIAEGIEKPEDMFTLIDIGVDYLQGYHLARPSFAPPKMLAIATAQISNYNKKKLMADQGAASPMTKIM